MGYSDGSHHVVHDNLKQKYMPTTNGNWDAQKRKVVNLAQGTDNDDGITKLHAENAFISKWNGGSIQQSLDLQFHELFNLRTNNNFDTSGVNGKWVKKWIREQLSSTLLWEWDENIAHGSVYRGDSTLYFAIDSSSRKLNTLYDQSRSGNDAVGYGTGTLGDTRPTVCSANQRINNRYYCSFNGSQKMHSQISINRLPSNTPGYLYDAFSVTLVYKLHNLNNGDANWHSSLWGTDPIQGGFKPFICFSIQSHLLISGTFGDYSVVNPASQNAQNWRNKIPIGFYQNRADPSVLNEWICLTVYYNRQSHTSFGSFVMCNGVKLGNFRASSTQATNTISIGDLQSDRNTFIAGFDGDIAYFSMEKGEVLTEGQCKLNHYCLCKKMFHIPTQNLDLGY